MVFVQTCGVKAKPLFLAPVPGTTLFPTHAQKYPQLNTDPYRHKDTFFIPKLPGWDRTHFRLWENTRFLLFSGFKRFDHLHVEKVVIQSLCLDFKARSSGKIPVMGHIQGLSRPGGAIAGCYLFIRHYNRHPTVFCRIPVLQISSGNYFLRDNRENFKMRRHETIFVKNQDRVLYCDLNDLRSKCKATFAENYL